MVVIKELFIVEGQSAASTVRQAMHKPTQSVFAIQGKLINAARASSARVFANQECKNLFQLLACGTGDECKPDRLEFSRLFILADPDADGAHVRALLLTLFDHYLQALISSGLVHVIIPPLFRVVTPGQKHDQYAWSESELKQMLEQTLQAHPVENNREITRFKGIAQFSSAECARLLLQPETRKSVLISDNNDLELSKKNGQKRMVKN